MKTLADQKGCVEKGEAEANLYSGLLDGAEHIEGGTRESISELAVQRMRLVLLKSLVRGCCLGFKQRYRWRPRQGGGLGGLQDHLQRQGKKRGEGGEGSWGRWGAAQSEARAQNGCGACRAPTPP